MDNTVSNRLGNTNTNSNQQQEPVFDENDTLNFGDSNNQQSMPEPTFNENDSLNFADDYDDVQQQLASRDDNDADIELNFGDAPTIDSDEVIIDLDDVRDIMFKPEKYSQISVKQLMKQPNAIIKINENMKSVMHKFDMSDSWLLPIVDQDTLYVGFVSKSNIFNKYRNGDFNWLKDWEPETKVIVIKEDNKSQED